MKLRNWILLVRSRVRSRARSRVHSRARVRARARARKTILIHSSSHSY